MDYKKSNAAFTRQSTRCGNNVGGSVKRKRMHKRTRAEKDEELKHSAKLYSEILFNKLRAKFQPLIFNCMRKSAQFGLTQEDVQQELEIKIWETLSTMPDTVVSAEGYVGRSIQIRFFELCKIAQRTPFWDDLDYHLNNKELDNDWEMIEDNLDDLDDIELIAEYDGKKLVTAREYAEDMRDIVYNIDNINLNSKAAIMLRLLGEDKKGEICGVMPWRKARAILEDASVEYFKTHMLLPDTFKQQLYPVKQARGVCYNNNIDARDRDKNACNYNNGDED